MTKPYKREKIGEVGVDSGQMLLGDPCYWMKGEAYSKICDEDGQINYEMGHPGKGVKVMSGYGDGTYDVFVTTNKEGRVMKMEVIFIADDEDSDW